MNSLKLLLNDLSFHGQLKDVDTFKVAIARLLAIRSVANSYGREVYCHRAVLKAQVTQTKTMEQVVDALTKDQKRSLTSWLLKHGYSWENNRKHPADAWFEHNKVIVTDSALGEAAWCLAEGIDCRLISVDPSGFNDSPIPVEWVHEDANRAPINVPNYWGKSSVQPDLKKVEAELASWDQLEELKNSRWPLLFFATDAFTPLKGFPFFSSAAQRILTLLDILNTLKSCYDEKGERTQQGNEIYQNHFTGKKCSGGKGADFKDSSTTEKNDFGKKLTFSNPEKDDGTIFCPWHGSVQTPQFRIHFSSPISHDEQLYIVYVGEKLTKR